MFGRLAGFGNTVFQASARFDDAAFEQVAWFESVSFPGEASFRSASFRGNAVFDDAIVPARQGRTDTWPLGWTVRQDRMVRTPAT